MKDNYLLPRDEPNIKDPRVGKVPTDYDTQVDHEIISEIHRLPFGHALGAKRIIRLLESEDPTAPISTDNTQDKGKHSLSDDHINTPNLPSGKSYPRPK